MKRKPDPSLINKVFREKIQITKDPEQRDKLIRRYQKAINNLDANSQRTMTFVGQL